MDPITQQTALAAAGAAGGEAVYVDDVFSTYVYTGDGSSSKAITTGLDISTDGGLVWIKSRETTTAGNDHILKSPDLTGVLRSNLTNADTGNSGDLVSLTTTGFNVNTTFQGGTWYYTNQNAVDYTSWSFKTTPGFFDVVTYTGNGTARTISHSLGSAPGCVIIKRTDAAQNWVVWHRSATQTNQTASYLNSTAAFSATGDALWGTPTTGTPDMNASTISLGNSSFVNLNGGSYTAYIFAHDDQSFGTDGNESIIRCGAYTGNGSADGPSVNLGFEPQWLLIKRSDAGGSDWVLKDVIRGMGAAGGKAYLRANTNQAEVATAYAIAESTGFKLNSAAAQTNTNGGTYLYIAIRRPHKPPETGTDVFDADTSSANTGEITSGFPTDLSISVDRGSTQLDPYNRAVQDRLRGGLILLGTSTSIAEVSNSSTATFDSNTGIILNGGSVYGSGYVHYQFKRAPGFFDIVAYTGSGTTSTNFNHNLEVSPELVILKNRERNATYWRAWHSDFSTQYFTFGAPSAAITGALMSVTDSTFSFNLQFGDNSNNTLNEDYIAYLFATLPGISKVGSYNGSSSDIQIDCGFTAGARFVMIKRVDAIGNWVVYDSTRGIVAGNDPSSKFDTNDSEDTGNDHIDPYSSGFTVVGGNTFINNTSASAQYIYLAIA